MKKDTDISERVASIIEYYGVTINKFAKDLGYKRTQTVYDIINRKSKPSFSFFDKLYNTEYSVNLNYEWLMTGKGEMMKPTYNQDNLDIVNEPKSDYKLPIPEGAIPFYNLSILGRNSLFELEGEIIPEGYIKDIPGAENTEILLQVHGYSMEAEVKEGAIIGIKKMEQWDTLNTEYKYLIITKNDRMIKYVEHDETDSTILWCTSPNYKRFKIYKDDVLDIHRITFVMNPE